MDSVQKKRALDARLETVASDDRQESIMRSTATPSPFSFPVKLHSLLNSAESEGFDSIVSWLPGGTSFRVHDTHLFETCILPQYFKQTKYKTFQRHLLLWGFESVPYGIGNCGYHHPCFQLGHPQGIIHMQKNTKKPAAKGRKNVQTQAKSSPKNARQSATKAESPESDGGDGVQNDMNESEEGTSFVPRIHESATAKKHQEAEVVPPLTTEGIPPLNELPPNDLKYVMLGIAIGSRSSASEQSLLDTFERICPH